MSTTTTNLELVKPAGNERVDVDVINSNYDKIDEFAGLAITDANYVHTDNNYTTTEKSKLSAIQPNATATSFTQTLVSGTAVGTITINGTDYVIYAPSSSGGASALNDLSDVTLASPSNGQVLKYNATTGKWENADESGGGGGYIPTGEVYTFFTDGSTAAANYSLYVQWTDGEMVTTALVVSYSQLITGWTTDDYQNVTINWDSSNQNFSFVAKSGSFECNGTYFDEGDTMGTLSSGNITFNAMEKEATGVDWTQVQLSGTKIAEIEIDGVSQNVYAPTPPTKTSDLTNDSNFVADASYVHTDNNYTSTEKNKLSGLVGVEANPSGTASTDLTKIAIGGTNYNIPSGGSGSSTFAGLSDVDIDDTTLANGQVPVWNSTTEKWENGAGGGGTTVVPNPQGTPTGELNTIQIGNDIYEIVGGSGGSAEWTDVVDVLEAGETELTLYSTKIKANSVVNPYASKVGVKASDMVVTNGSVTLTFPVQTEDLDVMIRISKVTTNHSYDIDLSHLQVDKSWFYYDASKTTVTDTGEGLRISGNDNDSSWTTCGVIGIHIANMIGVIPPTLSALKLHFSRFTMSGYTGVRFVNSNTLYSGLTGGSDVFLRIQGFYQFENNNSSIEEEDYTLTIPCSASNFTDTYFYIMVFDGMITGNMSNYNNSLNGAYDIIIDGIDFVTGGES